MSGLKIWANEHRRMYAEVGSFTPEQLMQRHMDEKREHFLKVGKEYFDSNSDDLNTLAKIGKKVTITMECEGHTYTIEQGVLNPNDKGIENIVIAVKDTLNMLMCARKLDADEECL